MNIKEQDIANMSYDAFSCLKMILSTSLNEISHMNEAQRIRMEEV